MGEGTYKFDIPTHQRSIIKVIGVGGGGSNAVNHMYNQGIKDVEFVVCNTDEQALQSSPVPNRLQIGENLTGGLGAGANPEKGRNAAIESKEEIRELLGTETKMVFITAGMGGGTGTGAAPIIAKVAKDLDILTVGIVTMPFAFEGRKKSNYAETGLRELKENCDTILVILNDKLREIYGNLPIREAFGQADDVLTTAAKGIAEIITVPGYVNVDFEDVRTVMKDSGAAVMGSAQTEGENRAIRAAEEAISSPLLNNRNIHGADKILLSIISGVKAELQMDELSEITDFIQEISGEDAEVIFGHGVDEELDNSIRVTVIATGFDHGYRDKDSSRIPEKKVFDLESSKQISLFEQEVKSVSSANEESKITDDEREDKSYFSESDLETEDENQETEELDFFDTAGNFDSTIEVIRENKEGSSEDNKREDWKVKAEKTVSLSSKREELLRQSRERISKLRSLQNSNPPINTDDFKEKLDVPAYLRKKVVLQDVPHSSEPNISKYNLNDDNQILGNNKFLHDNVD